jgi:hypothetical protein
MRGLTVCTETPHLGEAKTKVKKMAGEDVQQRKRLSAPTEDVHVGTLLDLVVEDYKQSGQKTIADARAKIDNGLRPFFEDMLAMRVDSDEVERWMRWRAARRLRGSPRRKTLQPASINRKLSLLRRAFQLGYERRPQLVDRIPPIKKLPRTIHEKGSFPRNSTMRSWRSCPRTCGVSHVSPTTSRTGRANCSVWSGLTLSLMAGRLCSPFGRARPRISLVREICG